MSVSTLPVLVQFLTANGWLVLTPFVNTASQDLALKHSTMIQENSYDDPSHSHHTRDPSISVPPSPTEAYEDRGSLSSFRVGVIIHRADVGFTTRVNTIPNFLEINRRVCNSHPVGILTTLKHRQLLSQTTYSLPTDQKDRSLIDQKAQISSDTIIGGSTQVSERTTIKKSVIGRHCIIGKMVKIAGCVLLDHCIVEDG